MLLIILKIMYWYEIWLCVCYVGVLVMVFVGGITRLTHSGLSILGEKVSFLAYNVKKYCRFYYECY